MCMIESRPPTEELHVLAGSVSLDQQACTWIGGQGLFSSCAVVMGVILQLLSGYLLETF